MNYISDDFKWDKLILINYPSGSGGDFFCNLLHMNYDSNHIFSPDKNNKFEWHIKGFQKITMQFFEFYRLKHIPIVDIDDIDYQNFKIHANKSYLDIIDKIYDEDFDKFKKNYIQYVRNSLYKKYSEGNFLANSHNSRPIKNFSMYEVFPEASIFFLYSENKKYNFIFKILQLIKNRNFNPINSKKSLKTRISSLIVNNTEPDQYKNYKVFDNMIGIDVGKLFFENGYEDEAENILSKKLNKKIKLNKELIEEYKKNNKNLIKNVMEIEGNIYEISIEEIVKIILEDYFIYDERKTLNNFSLFKKWESFM
jgi:hypothetical protein